MPPTLDSTPALWPFAVHVYALPGVAGLCLRLQDEHALDVNVLLAILWRACHGMEVDDAALERLLVAARPVQARVREIRALRQSVGSDRASEPRWQETYEQLKAAELAAERVALSMLEQSLASDPASESAPPPASPTGAVARELALAALGRLAERSRAQSCEPLLQALVEATLPRPSAGRDAMPTP